MTADLAPAELKGQVKTVRLDRKKSGGFADELGVGMVVDVPAEFPTQNIKSKIGKVAETVEHGVLRLRFFVDGTKAEITEFELGSHGNQAGLKVVTDDGDFALGDAGIEDAVSGLNGVFDIVDQVIGSVSRKGLK